MTSTPAAADLHEVRAQLQQILTSARSQAGDDPFTPWQQVVVHVGHALGYLSLLPAGPAPAWSGIDGDGGAAEQANPPQQLRTRLRGALDELDLLAGLDDVTGHHRRSLLLALGRADEALGVLADTPAPSGPAAA